MVAPGPFVYSGSACDRGPGLHNTPFVHGRIGFATLAKKRNSAFKAEVILLSSGEGDPR